MLAFFYGIYYNNKAFEITPKWWNGRRDGLKIHCWRQRVGSSPTFGTKTASLITCGFFYVLSCIFLRFVVQ